MIMRGMRSTMRGSRVIAMAMLVRGPTGTNTMSGPSDDMKVSTRKVTARSRCFWDRAGGRSRYSPWMPLSRLAFRGTGKSGRSIGRREPYRDSHPDDIEDAQRILGAHLHRDVAVHRGCRHELEVRVQRRKQEGNRVIGSRVDIQDELRWHRRCSSTRGPILARHGSAP